MLSILGRCPRAPESGLRERAREETVSIGVEVLVVHPEKICGFAVVFCEHPFHRGNDVDDLQGNVTQPALQNIQTSIDAASRRNWNDDQTAVAAA